MKLEPSEQSMWYLSLETGERERMNVGGLNWCYAEWAWHLRGGTWFWLKSALPAMLMAKVFTWLLIDLVILDIILLYDINII